MSVAWRCVLGLALASAPLPSPAETETVRSKTPQAQIDSFMKECSAARPDATCQCFVKTLVSNREGDFILDVFGTDALMKSATEEERQANGLAVLNRHGLKESEARAIAAKPNLDSVLDKTAKACA